MKMRGNDDEMCRLETLINRDRDNNKQGTTAMKNDRRMLAANFLAFCLGSGVYTWNNSINFIF